MYQELHDACCSLAADPSVRLVAIRGQGEAFAAGTDIADLVEVRTGADGIAYEGMITRVLNAVRALDVPVVGLVDGPAVAARNPGLLRPGLRHSPGAVRSTGGPDARQLCPPGTTARLRSVLGRALTAELLLTGRLISAEEARAAGFVRRVVSATEFDGSSKTWWPRCRAAPRCRWPRPRSSAAASTTGAASSTTTSSPGCMAARTS